MLVNFPDSGIAKPKAKYILNLIHVVKMPFHQT